MEKIQINGKTLTIEDVAFVARKDRQVEVSLDVLPAMKRSRDLVEKVTAENRVVYGITTGFGKFSDVSITTEDSKQLQKNLIMSHACGVGQPFAEEIVRAMMLLRLNALSVGNSGISQETFFTLVDMLNKGVIPIVPEQGSLGASGDLVPLAHMALVMIGQGEAVYKGVKMSGAEAMKKAGINPCTLTSKEGLALINGTQAMNAISSLAIKDAINLSKSADIIAALTMEGLECVIDAFDERIHKVRKQKGQIECANNIRKILSGSKCITRQGEKRVQDAYSIRCIPQIHGITKDSLEFVKGIIANEINAATDNPLIFAETEESFSSGNFHGQYLSMAMDFLAIAVAELADVSERRTERMVNPALSNGLPAFLVHNGGLNSGFMIPQYVAAAIVSENKVLAHPAVVDSIPTSANQEDHVSMGMTAARKARTIVTNTTRVLGIELFCACQAIELRKNIDSLSRTTRAVFNEVRKAIPYVKKDEIMNGHIEMATTLVESGKLIDIAEKLSGNLA